MEPSQPIYSTARIIGGELNLAVWQSTFVTVKLKLANINFHTCIPVYTYGDPLPNHQIYYKSATIFAMVIWGPTAKFNSCQYFRLFGNLWHNS